MVSAGKGIFAMSAISLRRYLPKLKTIFDVRARLVLVALILVVPLMFDRVAHSRRHPRTIRSRRPRPTLPISRAAAPRRSAKW